MKPEEIPVWEPFLKRTLIFADLAVEDLVKVAEKLQRLSLPKGATLYSRGDSGDAFYIIASGQVRLLSERAGKEVVTAFLGPGDALGELSLLTGEPRSVTVKLDVTSEFLMLAKKDFDEVVRETPSILMHLSRILSQRLTRTNQAPEPPKALSHQLLALFDAVSGAGRTLLLMRLGLDLVEQTHRRVLLVDTGPDCGSLAKALGMKPVLTTEAMLREQDLRDPMILRSLAAEHPSGLSVLSLPASVLGGRLYRGIFLLMNLLRERYDLVLFAMGSALGDVEKSILEETDLWVLVGERAGKESFERLEAELPRAAPAPKKTIKVWIGERDAASSAALARDEASWVPWPEDLPAEYARGISPFQVFDRFPKTARALRRLARRLGGLRIGLAMGTGAALGYSLIGILKALKAAGIEVDIVAGTSIGSIIGGFHALGLEPEEVQALAEQVDKAWVYENLFWDLTLPRAGLFAGVTLLRFIRSYFGTKEFHELELPFACVAADIETGEEVLLKEGRVAEAIRASCGIPILFQPFHHEGRFLVDGGLVDPVPTRVISQLGADILISINLTMPAGRRKSAVRERRDGRPSPFAELARLRDLTMPEVLKSPNMLEILFQMIYTMEYEIAQSRVDLAHVVIHPDLGGFSWTEMHRAKDLVAAGERAAEEALPKIKAVVPFFADHCKVPISPRGLNDLR